MDENKRLKLVDVGYCIDAACGMCTYGLFVQGNDFGKCLAHKYDHLKHTEGNRDMSVYRYGSCGSYSRRGGIKEFLHAYADFMNEGDGRGP